MKPPAFQCYPDDLLAGTADMTAEEFGVYWRLVCHSWNKDGLPNDDTRLALLAGQCGGNAVAYAKTKFEVCPDGRLRNPRLEQVRQQQEEYRAQQSANAKVRWGKRPLPAETGDDAAALPAHMRSECSPSPSPTPKELEREHGEQTAEDDPNGYQPRGMSPGPSPFPEANVPTWEEVKVMAASQCITEAVARSFFDHYDSKNLWLNRHGRMVNVLNCLKIWDNREKTLPKKTNGEAGGKGVSRSVELMNLKAEHDEVQKRIALLMDRDPHMDMTPAERDELKRKKARRKELRKALGWAE